MKEEIFYLESPFGMYWERIIPEIKKYSNPIIMIPGVAHTGSCYKSTPDGRPGWAYYFANKGYEVIITDWPGTGRSGAVPFQAVNGEFIVNAYKKLIDRIGKDVILVAHSMSGPYAWKLAELRGDKISHIIGIAPGQMGNIQPAPDIIQRDRDITRVRMPWGVLKIDLTQYLINDKPFINKLIGNSSLFPFESIESYRASLQMRHPRLTFERLNIDQSQLQIKNFKKVRQTKVLVIAGDSDIDHTKEIDQTITDFFIKNGIKAQFLWLADIGIKGNGHMMMLEENSDEIAKLIFKYLDGESW